MTRFMVDDAVMTPDGVGVVVESDEMKRVRLAESRISRWYSVKSLTHLIPDDGLREGVREWWDNWEFFFAEILRTAESADSQTFKEVEAELFALLDTPEAERDDILNSIEPEHDMVDDEPPPAAVTREEPVNLFLAAVREELVRARAKFPGDRIMAIACAEEFGELMKALLDEPGSAVWKEAVQTAVMAARVAIDGDNSVDELRRERGLDDHRCGDARLRGEDEA